MIEINVFVNDQNKEIFKSTTGLETDDFQVLVVRISNFMMAKITILKVSSRC